MLSNNSSLHAQKWRSVLGRIDSVVTENYFSGKYDTAYIGRPEGRLTLKLRANVSGSTFKVRRRIEGSEGRTNLKTDHKATISIGANYMGITAGIAVNPAKLKGKSQDFELNANIYNNRYGIDVIYQSSKTLSGNVEFNGESGMLEKGMVNFQTLNLNGYYAFNGDQFSYPAAFTQSYIQKRSAGSFLAGFSYLGEIIKTSEKAPEGSSTIRIYVGYFAIGGGYGYNLVAGKHLLFHLSTLPSLVIANRNNISVDGERIDMKTHFPDFIFTGRMSAVYNFNARHFIGFSCIVNNSVLGYNKIDINYDKWRTRLFYGIRL